MTVRCDLCPKACLLKEGQRGDCRMRVNLGGRLTALTYGYPCSVHVDPVEKKPMFHFMPGTGILSIATAGCNLHCKNCQNWEISQADPEDIRAVRLAPSDLVTLAERQKVKSVAYTYTEPSVYYEYTLDSSRLVRKAGLKNVLVTAACINAEPWRELCKYTDGANIDLKFMDERLYRDNCDGYLKPVLDNLVTAVEAGVLVEVTNLVIPTLNDSDEALRKLCKWIRANLGGETPLHFSRFFPRYKLTNLPPTPQDTMKRARDIAVAEGLRHVYVGNILIEGSQDTRCANPKCGMTLIKRRGYHVFFNKVTGGKCPGCGREVKGVWK
jgi:pyruvate formate lyase activating enzyme